MSDAIVVDQHPIATEHLPVFLTAPGDTDTLLVVMTIFMFAAVIGIGVFYFKLHSLPEQMAHRGQKVQFEIVAVLGLLSLFTHNHLFWIAGLLLALVPLPDFTTPLRSMAQSLGSMAGASTRSGHAETGSVAATLDQQPEAGTPLALSPVPPPLPSRGHEPCSNSPCAPC